MKLKTADGGWNPYLAGAMTGVLMILSVVVAGKYFEASTTMVRAAAMIEQKVAPEHVAKAEYYQKEKPIFDWQWLFVAGVFVGGLITSVAFGDFKLESVPPIWKERFGRRILPRAAVAFLGGFIALFGARLAGGCPSGHGLTGGLQLSVSGYVALICFFVGGLIVANLVYRKGARHG